LSAVNGHTLFTSLVWYRPISALVARFDPLGLKPGHHLFTLLLNRSEAATIHWACQFAGIIVTPLNWRSSADELDYCLDDAEAKAIAYEEVSAAAVRSSHAALMRPRVAIGLPESSDISFESIVERKAEDGAPRVDAAASSV